MERGLLLRSFTPLYFGRVASWVIEARELPATRVEERKRRDKPACSRG
jgi:hypothetical protein